MTTELEQALRSTAGDLTLDTSADDVLVRGDRHRRRRRRGVALGASGVVALTAVGVAALGGGQQPERSPLGAEGGAGAEGAEGWQAPSFRVASWSSHTTNLTAEQLAEVRETCAAEARGLVEDNGFTEPGWLLAGMNPPVAAELRDGLALAYFRDGRDYQTCALDVTGDGGFRVSAQSAGVESAVPSGRPVALSATGASDPGPQGGPLSGVYFVVRTTPDVATVEIGVAGETYEADADGIALFWLPDGVMSQAELDRATVAALDGDAEVLYRSGPGEDW